MTDDTADFTTIAHVPGSRNRYVAQLRHWDKTADAYQVTRESAPTERRHAESIAEAWARAYHVECRT